LKQYLSIKQEEDAFKAEHPEHRVKARVVFDALPKEDENSRMASVLIY